MFAAWVHAPGRRRKNSATGMLAIAALGMLSDLKCDFQHHEFSYTQRCTNGTLEIPF